MKKFGWKLSHFTLRKLAIVDFERLARDVEREPVAELDAQRLLELGGDRNERLADPSVVHQRPATTRLSGPSSSAHVRFCSRAANVLAVLAPKAHPLDRPPLIAVMRPRIIGSTRDGCAPRCAEALAGTHPARSGGMLMKK